MNNCIVIEINKNVNLSAMTPSFHPLKNDAVIPRGPYTLTNDRSLTCVRKGEDTVVRMLARGRNMKTVVTV